MVQRIARRTSATLGTPPGVDTSDLVSSGVLGLAEAWGRFDPKRGVAFEAFAVPRVKGAIVDAIRASDWIPRKAREKARSTGESLVVLVSIDGSRGDGDGWALERLADDRADLPGDGLLAAESRRELVGLFDKLRERERMILTLHYLQGVTLRVIARSLGVTDSRVSQIHTCALLKLRAGLGAIDEASESISA